MSTTQVNLGLDTRPRKFTASWSDFVGFGATSGDIELFSLPAGGIITMVKIKHSTGFTGTAQTSFTLSVGIVGNLIKYHPAYEVNATANPAGPTTFSIDSQVGSENHGSATSIRLAANSDVNLSALTAGAVDVWVWTTTAV